jgi:hypothetical protein
MMTPEERKDDYARSAAARALSEKSKAQGGISTLERKTAPDVSVSERSSAPQEAMHRGDLETAQALIDARLGSNVFGQGTGAITFSDASLVPRWFNEAVNPQRLFQAQQDGWLPVRPEMIADLQMLGVYSVNTNGHVVRGQRGEEHLCFMSKVNAGKIAIRKTQETDRQMGSSNKARSSMAENVASMPGGGDQAADFIAGKMIGQVTDTIERMERIPDTE